MSYRLKVQGKRTIAEVEEDGTHAIMRLVEPRALSDPDDRVKVVSVFVQVPADADVAVSVNGEWWSKP